MTFRFLLLTLLILAGCAKQPVEEQIAIGVMPKLVGIDYFNACEKGALEAGKELGVKIVYDGPITNDVTKQAEMIDTWITRRLNVITVAPPNAKMTAVAIMTTARTSWYIPSPICCSG